MFFTKSCIEIQMTDARDFPNGNYIITFDVHKFMRDFPKAKCTFFWCSQKSAKNLSAWKISARRGSERRWGGGGLEKSQKLTMGGFVIEKVNSKH